MGVDLENFKISEILEIIKNEIVRLQEKIIRIAANRKPEKAAYIIKKVTARIANFEKGVKLLEFINNYIGDIVGKMGGIPKFIEEVVYKIKADVKLKSDAFKKLEDKLTALKHYAGIKMDIGKGLTGLGVCFTLWGIYCEIAKNRKEKQLLENAEKAYKKYTAKHPKASTEQVLNYAIREIYQS